MLVFGDFDADGLTGLAILTIALRRFGVAVEPYVPSRLDEGHGLSLAAIDTAERLGARIIVTVDCGSTEPMPRSPIAQRREIDVLVTPRPRPAPELPPAVAVVSPHPEPIPVCGFAFGGSGVAFKVAQALLADLPGGPEAALQLADLATIGTVADVAPIVGRIGPSRASDWSGSGRRRDRVWRPS